MALSSAARAWTAAGGAKRNSAAGSMNRVISHGQATRSIFGRSRVIHRIGNLGSGLVAPNSLTITSVSSNIRRGGTWRNAFSHRQGGVHEPKDLADRARGDDAGRLGLWRSGRTGGEGGRACPYGQFSRNAGELDGGGPSAGPLWSASAR